MNFLRKIFGQTEDHPKQNKETPSVALKVPNPPASPTLYAFFARGKNNFVEVVDTSPQSSWISKVRQEAQMPNATVILIDVKQWNAPNLAAPTAENIRDAWPSIKINVQNFFMYSDFQKPMIDLITIRPIATTVNPLTNLVVFIFAYKV